MVDQAVIEDMVDYIMKLNKELSKKGFTIEWQNYLFSMFIFYQFNATRNDTMKAFNQIVNRINEEYKKQHPEGGPT